MNRHEGVVYLFNIAKELKRAFDSPVILVTLEDYADCIINSTIDVRTALLQNAAPERVAEIVQTFHLEWLHAVQDIENFKTRLKNTPRETILKAIDYSIECVQNRQKYFQKYIEQLYSTMTGEEKQRMQIEMKSIQDLGDIVTCALIEKKKCLRYQSDQREFYIMVADEIENLMDWLDRLNNFLAIVFSKVLNLGVSELPDELTKTLQDIIEEVTANRDPEEEKIARKIISKGKILETIDRVYSSELQMRKIVDKINILENRIHQLKIEESSALLAVQHKTIHLEERLQSLENLQTTLNILKTRRNVAFSDDTSMENKIHIFNHMLPSKQRCRLIDQLLKLWDNAIRGDQNRHSIISILSVTDMKEIFYDDLGQFTVDKYGRKIYCQEGDSVFYQSNEKNQLVALEDDEKHVYFYDECGRYYLNEVRERVYKAHEKASEYILHRDGVIFKVKEEKDGIVYRYDSLGRYYVNELGKHIYYDQYSANEYEHDEFGNLVRLRHSTKHLNYGAQTREPMVMEESKYLRNTVGVALKKCLADVVLTQPADPVEYLANCLEKYRYDMESRQQRIEKAKGITIERELLPAVEQTTPSSMDAEEYVDYDVKCL